MITQKEFIKRSKEVHGNKYDYSLVNYINCKEKVKIICKEHGVFEQVASTHYYSECGCPLCGRVVSAKKQTSNEENFIKRVKEIHGNKYDYSNVNYINANTHIDVFCNIHKELFKITPSHHLDGQGCKKCKYGTLSNKFRMSKEKFIEKSINVHGDIYDYSNVNYINAHTKVEIICFKHGSFFQTYNHHVHSKRGCPKCKSSKGEKTIREWLIENNIKFEEQKKFNELGMRMRYDFYLPDYNLLIEFDGEQHFKPIKYFGGNKSFEKLQRRDTIKNEYAIENRYKLLRIAHTEFNRIEELLLEILV